MAIALVGEDATGFGVTGAGFAYNIPFGAPAVDDLDILGVNSDALINTPSGFTLRESEVANQGSYVFTRKAVGGETATITISTPSGAGPFNATLQLKRFSGTDAFDVSAGVQNAPGSGTSTPAISSGALAGNGDELVLMFAALHSFNGNAPHTPIWSAGYVGTLAASQGAAGGSSSCASFAGYKLTAGPAAETPSVSWTESTNDRYALLVAFTAAAVADTVEPDGLAIPLAVGTPALTDGSMEITPSGLAIPIAFGPPTVAGPPGPAADQLFFPAVQSLLVCLCTALNQQANPPDICCLRAGDSVVQDMGINLDECCSGQAYVRPAGFYATGDPNSPFPSPSTDAAITPCGVTAWGLQIEMGVFRCMPTTSPVTCAQWETVTLQHMADAKAMREAICCWMAQYDPSSVSLGQWAPVGPDGGCIGSTWMVSIQIDNCDEC